MDAKLTVKTIARTVEFVDVHVIQVMFVPTGCARRLAQLVRLFVMVIASTWLKIISKIAQHAKKTGWIAIAICPQMDVKLTTRMTSLTVDFVATSVHQERFVKIPRVSYLVLESRSFVLTNASTPTQILSIVGHLGTVLTRILARTVLPI
jgi:hypothetical protein